jgi:hypothetical protein
VSVSCPWWHRYACPRGSTNNSVMVCPVGRWVCDRSAATAVRSLHRLPSDKGMHLCCRHVCETCDVFVSTLHPRFVDIDGGSCSECPGGRYGAAAGMSSRSCSGACRPGYVTLPVSLLALQCTHSTESTSRKELAVDCLLSQFHALLSAVCLHF